jgi:hypothetical protein
MTRTWNAVRDLRPKIVGIMHTRRSEGQRRCRSAHRANRAPIGLGKTRVRGIITGQRAHTVGRELRSLIRIFAALGEVCFLAYIATQVGHLVVGIVALTVCVLIWIEHLVLGHAEQRYLGRRLTARARLKMSFRRSFSRPAAHEYVYRWHGEVRHLNDDLWHGSCKCGWRSKPRRQADLVHDEYREHVSRELGRKARYSAQVVCGNCSYRGTVKQFVGMHISHADCPRCQRGCLKAP